MISARIFRLFISSTFSDFEAEREALQERVFPELEEFCRSRGATFQAIDLRWGITEEAQREHETMRICLEELRRCQELSPKPNFVALLGNRYGWEPAPARIPADHWDRLVSAARPPDCELIRSGYMGPDLNAVPPVYHLRKREGSQASCIARENLLRDALRQAADAAGFCAIERIPYFGSATHQEIALGALAEKDASGRDLDAAGHVHIYIRQIIGLPGNATAARFIDWDEAGDSPVVGASDRLNDLKAELRSRLPAQVREFDTFWSGDGIETVHLEEFCARFLEDQKAIIQRELDSVPIHDDARAREEAHINFAKERARNFQGRTEVLEQVERHLTGSIITNSPLIIHGEGGAGKSAVIAQTFQNACADAHCGEVIARFIGGASGADNLYDLLTNLVADIARKFGHSRPPIAETIIDAREHFAWALSLSSAERPLLLFLDGIDQLNDKEAELLLKWLPEPLRHTKLVISCRSEKKLISAAIRLGMNTLELGALSPEDGKQLLDAWLNDTREASYNAGIAPSLARALTLRQREAILDAFVRNGKPLWLRLAYEEARTWPSWYGDNDPEALKLPDTIEGMVRDLINRRLLSIEKHPAEFTKRALAYISAARLGLSDQELGRALATDQSVRQEFLSQTKQSGQSWKVKLDLPPILWSRLYFDLQPYLAQVYSDGAMLLRWFHREFKEQIEAMLLCNEEQRQKIHGHLAGTFSSLAVSGKRKLFLYTETGPGRQVAALRRVIEEPWQLAKAGMMAELRNLLFDFGFCLAKCAAGEIHDLEQDFNAAGMRRRASFIRSNKHILSGHPTIGSWPKYRVMLQLALEEDPESGIFKSARRWLSSGAVEWNVIIAPAKTPKNTSLRIRAGVRHDESIQVCLDEDNNIVVMDESGLCQSYHGSDGSPLGACDMPAEFIARAELSETPPRGMELINAWPIGDGRWFGWNGLVWHFNPTADRWEELPRGHHHQVWFATGLPSGGFASLGVYANVGTLAVWCDEGTKPEIISIPHYPRHHLDGNAPQLTGIVEISDGRYLIWPFMDDGSAAYLKRTRRPDHAWQVYRLAGTQGIMGALPLAPIDGDPRFVTWLKDGEVRMWQESDLPRGILHKRGARSPWQLGGGGALNAEGFRGNRGMAHLNKAPAGTDLEGARKLVEGININALDALAVKWFSWKSVFEDAKRDAFTRYNLDISEVINAAQNGIKAVKDASPKAWTALLLGLLEDQKSLRPLFGKQRRKTLIMQVCEEIERIYPPDLFPALVKANYSLDSRDDRGALIKRLLSDENFRWENARALLALFCEESHERAHEECVKLISNFPHSWELAVSLAVLTPEPSTEMYIDASLRPGCPPFFGKLADDEGVGPWEIITGGKRGVWISGATDPLMFHWDGQSIFVTGDLSGSVQELSFLN